MSRYRTNKAEILTTAEVANEIQKKANEILDEFIKDLPRRLRKEFDRLVTKIVWDKLGVTEDEYGRKTVRYNEDNKPWIHEAIFTQAVEEIKNTELVSLLAKLKLNKDERNDLLGAMQEDYAEVVGSAAHNIIKERAEKDAAKYTETILASLNLPTETSDDEEEE